METKYKRIIIFYFSGTGNSKLAAEWIAETAETYNLEVNLFCIDTIEKVELPANDLKILIGFCSPTHGFNFPPVMLKFIRRFPKRPNTDVFILNTRAGMKIYRWFTPGLSGAAHFVAAFWFLIKGFKIVGLKPLDMPSNWISLHPGLRKTVVLSIIERCNKQTKRFSEMIITGRKTYWQALISFPIDLAIAPIAIGYYLVGRFALAKTFIATDKCTNCGLCQKQCPVKAIKTTANLPYWTMQCESCMKCMNHCPNRAIETTHSFTFILWYLISVLCSLILSKALEYNILPFDKNTWIYNIFDFALWSALFLIIPLIAYKGLHYLMRYRIVNQIIRYTSFTSFKFWRRYKIPTKTKIAALKNG